MKTKNMMWMLVLTVITMVWPVIRSAVGETINDKVEVEAKEDMPAPSDIPLGDLFRKVPTGDKDRIEVTNEGALFVEAGTYGTNPGDPYNDGADFYPYQESGPVKVDLEGREGIGGVYIVTVVIVGEGEGDEEPPLHWAAAGDMAGGTLTLTDLIEPTSQTQVSLDSSDVGQSFFCKTDENNKGKIVFNMQLEYDVAAQTVFGWKWEVSPGYPQEQWDENPLLWEKTLTDIEPGEYVLKVTGYDDNYELEIPFVVGLGVEVLDQPEYLFADAEYATTIRYQIDDLLPLVPENGKPEDIIESINIEFFVDGTSGFSVDVYDNNRTVGVDGSDLVLLSSYEGDVFESYVRSGEYSGISLSEGNATEDAYFVVTVGVDVGGQTELVSGRGDVGEFADNEVPAADIRKTRYSEPVPDNATYHVSPTRESYPFKNVTVQNQAGFEVVNYHVEPEIERCCWDGGDCNNCVMEGIVDPSKLIQVYPNYPIYEHWGTYIQNDIGPIYASHDLSYGPYFSEAEVGYRADTPNFNTMVDVRNLGNRSGVWINISYGGKDGTTESVLSEILDPGESAMDYAIATAVCDLAFYTDGVEIVEYVDDIDSGSLAPLGTALGVVGSIFTKGIVSIVYGITTDIFLHIYTSPDVNVSHSAHAQIEPLYEWRHPNGSGGGDESGPRLFGTQSQTTYRIREYDLELDTGSSFFVFADMSTRIQITADNSIHDELSPSSAKCVLDRTEDPYMRVYEKN